MMLLTACAEGQCYRRSPRIFVAATVLCLVLLALLAVVQVAHVHPLQTDADHCPLCIAFHAATPVAVAAAIVIVVQVGTPVPILEPRAVLHHWHPNLFTRPPPAVL